MTIYEQYTKKCQEWSDIYEHLPTLFRYATECSHITECGVRGVTSSYAFANALKGRPGNKLIQVDLETNTNVVQFQSECREEGVNTVFYQESDLLCPVEDTELLFIDTWHVYGHLKRELARWHSSVSKYIILHDTTSDEWLGETVRLGWDAEQQSRETSIPVEEITKGLWPAVQEFLTEHPEWSLKERFTNNCGLTVLARNTDTSFSNFFFKENKKLPVHKWHHYFDVYERHFSKYKKKNPVILEVGVYCGGSLEMWNWYFGEKCKIYGVDIHPDCKHIENKFDNVRVLIGDQGDDAFLSHLIDTLPPIDILIDDGSHVNWHVNKTFDKLYSKIAPGGVYLIEDTHTSYWPEYGGGFRTPGTSIEHMKLRIDDLNAKHSRSDIADLEFSNVTNSIHFYDSIMVIEKHVIPQSSVEATIRGPGI